MISQSRDGDRVSPVARRLGLCPVRGSGSRGSKSAVVGRVSALSQHPCAVHVCDGPKGPKGEVKPGLIRVAQVSGAAIFPLYISAEDAWVMRSWDRFLIPKPLSRVLIRWGQPISVPPDTDAEGFERIRWDVQQQLIDGHVRDDLHWGWKTPL